MEIGDMMIDTTELPITVLMQYRSHSGEAMQKYIIGYQIGHKTVDLPPVVWTPEEYQRVRAEAAQVLVDYPAMKAKLIREVEEHARAKEQAEIRRQEQADAFWAERDKRIKADMARGPANHARHMRWLEANKSLFAEDWQKALADLKAAQKAVRDAEKRIINTCNALDKIMSGHGGLRAKEVAKAVGVSISRIDRISDKAVEIEDQRNGW
jgi:hypothetical protein